MYWKHGVGMAGLWGLLWSRNGWAAGTAIQALVDPVSSWVLTIQLICGLLATILLIVTGILIWRAEAAGLVTLIFAVVAIAVMIKAGDIIASFGPGRAAAAGVTPVVITAGQQMLDVAQSLIVHLSAGVLLLEGIVRGRRARRV